MISDEQIVGAILHCGTAIEAAKMLGVDPSTIYRRMRTNSAQAIYRSVQADLLRQTVEDLCDVRDDALTVIRDIMSDCDVNPAVRLQAAQAVLSNDLRYSEQLARVEDRAKDAFIDVECEIMAESIVKKRKEIDKKSLERMRKKGF